MGYVGVESAQSSSFGPRPPNEKLLPTPLTVENIRRYSITPVVKKLHCLPVNYRSVFKTAELVYKFLYTNFPKHCAANLSSYISFYNTRYSGSVGNFSVVPKFHPSTQKSVKQFSCVLPLFGMLFLMRFVHPLLLPLERSTVA